METPWSDCKVAYGVDDADRVWQRLAPERGAPTAKLPDGWTLNETDCSGARCVAVFRVEGAPNIEDGTAVLTLLRQIGAIRRRYRHRRLAA